MENEPNRLDAAELGSDAEPGEEQVEERRTFVAPELKRVGSVVDVTGFTF